MYLSNMLSTQNKVVIIIIIIIIIVKTIIFILLLQKYVCNHPALIVIKSLKTHSLPLLLSEYNFVTTVLVYVVKVHSNHIQYIYVY